jgi:flagellar motility protein MotE (MotC chaperone)
MQRYRTMIIGALVVATALLGGWRATRAAAPASGAPADAGTIASADDESFRRLLDEVRRRGQSLEQRERDLDARAAALESLEAAVAQSLTELESHGGSDATGACRFRGGVTRIYESMRPEEAAQILDQLDDETLRVVFARMEPKQIAAIMAAMSRERAVAFTKTLAADPEPAPSGRTAKR